MRIILSIGILAIMLSIAILPGIILANRIAREEAAREARQARAPHRRYREAQRAARRAGLPR